MAVVRAGIAGSRVRGTAAGRCTVAAARSLRPAVVAGRRRHPGGTTTHAAFPLTGRVRDDGARSVSFSDRSSHVALAAADATAPPAEAPVAKEKIRIKLRAYFPKPLTYACDKIREVATETGAEVRGPVMMPSKRKIWCVLRSPHVNKDSREHFQQKVHSRLMDIVGPSATTVDQLMALQMPAGVEVTIKLL